MSTQNSQTSSINKKPSVSTMQSKIKKLCSDLETKKKQYQQKENQYLKIKKQYQDKKGQYQVASSQVAKYKFQHKDQTIDCWNNASDAAKRKYMMDTAYESGKAGVISAANKAGNWANAAKRFWSGLGKSNKVSLQPPTNTNQQSTINNQKQQSTKKATI